MMNILTLFHDLRKQRRIVRIRKRVLHEIAGECLIVYDAFPYNNKGLPVDNLDKIAVTGLTQVEDEIWNSYHGNMIESPTWLQLAVEANNMAVASDDNHHVYFENVEVMRTTKEGVKILSLDMGS